ncbi:hypothetical protein [Sphingomonas faeni]|uniref:hypothetical protein n=1 Tax=Sphingomonas faeni TaxID=185950 RepID=UPI00335932E8
MRTRYFERPIAVPAGQSIARERTPGDRPLAIASVFAVLCQPSFFTSRFGKAIAPHKVSYRDPPLNSQRS